MQIRRSMTPSLAALALVAAALALAGAAFAAVVVYTNDFGSRSEFGQLERAGGKNCEQSYRQESESMLVSVKRGPTACSFRPPVQGDGGLPDQELRVEGKVLDKTVGSARGGAFLEVSVRDGGGGVGYALRVFPEKGRFELIRGPNGGEFPVTGKSDAIKKIGAPNQLSLSASGSQLTALVNGKEVAKLSDEQPGEVDGRKLRFGLGSDKDSGKDVVGTVKRVVVAVP